MLINPFQAANPTSPHTIHPIGAAEPNPCYRVNPSHSTPIWADDQVETLNGHKQFVQVVSKNANLLPMQQISGINKAADLRDGYPSVLDVYSSMGHDLPLKQPTNSGLGQRQEY